MKTLHRPRALSRQRGVVLLVCLIILVVLLAGGAAVMRSMNSSLFSAGNLSFKRDLVNQGELAVSRAMLAFQPGGALATAAATAVNQPAANYSAVQLVTTNPRGIPDVLLKKATLSGPDITGATFTPAGGDISGRGGVTVRYVIDRLCNTTGDFTTLGNSACVFQPSATQVTGGSSQRARDDLPPPVPAIYRLTVRVDGPRDTQVFLQSSFTKPE